MGGRREEAQAVAHLYFLRVSDPLVRTARHDLEQVAVRTDRRIGKGPQLSAVQEVLVHLELGAVDLDLVGVLPLLKLPEFFTLLALELFQLLFLLFLKFPQLA